MIPFEMAVPGTRATCVALLWSLESINDVWRGPYRRVTMLLSMSDEKCEIPTSVRLGVSQRTHNVYPDTVS